MKKAFDQTVRDLKREVNKKVLKVPSIEQKVLDSTSNEPWGPHGAVLADIAQASRNYHEYQIIMAIIWKRINDTGKNWRHVYKALTVLEYMVANGSERVIDDIREHSYQIQTLSDFQYLDSSGRDQGNNVRKKSQSLIVLVNDKERIVEVRQKAAANREKYRGTYSSSVYRPGSGGYEDERYDGQYGSRDEERNGHGRERDDDRYGRYGDSYGRDGDRHDREYEDRYSRDGYKDDDYRGRSRSEDGYQYGSRSRSSDSHDRAREEDGQYTSRSSAAMGDANSQDGSNNLEKRIERKFSEPIIGAPPSYEEAVGVARSPTYNEQGGEIASVPAQPTFTSPPATSPPPPPPPVTVPKEPDSFDEFDPRGPFSAATAGSSAGEMDLLGTLSESFSANSLALVPVDSATSAPGTDAFGDAASGPTFVGTSSSSTFDDPFGDGPFKAFPSSTEQLPTQNTNSVSSSLYRAVSDSFPSGTYALPSASTTVEAHQKLSVPNHGIDILADILPQAPQDVPQTRELMLQNNQSDSQTRNQSQNGQIGPQTGAQEGLGQSVAMGSFSGQPGQPFLSTGLHSGHHVPPTNQTAPASQPLHTGVSYQVGQPLSYAGSPYQTAGFQALSVQHNESIGGSYRPQIGFTGQSNANANANAVSQSMVPASTGFMNNNASRPAEDKIKTKSTVWTDTLNRGLVNLNISGTKTNPLADIGVDFDAINRKEKRMEKPTLGPAVSNVTMGKAMGSGSGLGRAGAGVLRPPSTPMMGGMGGGPRPSIGMGGYGAMNQPMGVAGTGMNMPPSMGGIGQGGQMQQPMGFPPGGYNPMMGTGNYGQQPYRGGGYR